MKNIKTLFIIALIGIGTLTFNSSAKAGDGDTGGPHDFIITTNFIKITE